MISVFKLLSLFAVDGACFCAGKNYAVSVMKDKTDAGRPALPPVVLVGPRCAGKTTVGRLLARRLGVELYDTDALIEEASGLSVADIVAKEGWESFRRRESEALAAALRPDAVVSTGGGMVLDAHNRIAMRAAGLVFYLAAPLECLYSRLARSRNPAQRPPLAGADSLAEMALVLEERESLYRECAHHSVDASVAAAKVAGVIFRIVRRA